MMLPSVFGENLFDDVFDDFWGFPSFDDKAMRKAERKLYGRHTAKMMKTDVQEHDFKKAIFFWKLVQYNEVNDKSGFIELKNSKF